MSDWEHILEAQTRRALLRIRIAAPDLATARAKEAQAHESYSDAIYMGDHTLLRLAERNAWRRYIEEIGGDDEWTWKNMRT